MIFHCILTYILVIFLGHTKYILTYKNQFQIYTSLISVIYRDVTSTQLYCSFFLLSYYLCKHYIYQCINPTVHYYYFTICPHFFSPLQFFSCPPTLCHYCQMCFTYITFIYISVVHYNILKKIPFFIICLASAHFPIQWYWCAVPFMHVINLW